MTLPQHPPISQFPIEDDCLVIGGIPLTRLAQRVGATPFYVYDRRSVSVRVEALRQHLPATIDLHYAVKANPMPALVCHLAGIVDGLDVASAGELRIALDSGMAAQDISFAGPGKSDAEISQAIASGALLNVESPMRRSARHGSETASPCPRGSRFGSTLTSS